MKRKALWSLLLVAFGVINVYAVVAGGLSGLSDYLGRLGPWGIVATVDLLIALFLGIVWMWRDARANGATPLPYVLLTLGTGSLGLLLYLVRHDDAVRREAGR